MPRVRRHGVAAGGDILETFAVDGFGENGGRGSAVAGNVAGLTGRLLDELGAHVLVGVFQLDLLGDGDAVLGDGGAAPALVEHGIAAARPQSAADRPGQLADARQQFLPCLVRITELLCHTHLLSSFTSPRYPPAPEEPIAARGNVQSNLRVEKQPPCRKQVFSQVFRKQVFAPHSLFRIRCRFCQCGSWRQWA